MLVRNGYGDRAMNWLKRDRKNLFGRDSWGVGKHGVLPGVLVVYEKWIYTSPPATETRSCALGREKKVINGRNDISKKKSILWRGWDQWRLNTDNLQQEKKRERRQGNRTQGIWTSEN